MAATPPRTRDRLPGPPRRLPPANEPTIAAGVARALLELAVSKGAGRPALLERSAIEPADLADADRRIPLPRYIALMRAGQALSRDPALGLHFGEACDLADISIVGALAIGSATAGEAFAQVNRYARLAADLDGTAGVRFQVRLELGVPWVVDTRERPNDFPELTESVFARAVTASRRLLGHARLFRAVRVTHQAPGYRAEYDRIFGVPVAFGSRWNALGLDPSWVSQRLTPSPRYARALLGAHADALLADLERFQSTRGQVERVLRHRLPGGDLGVAAVARALAQSRQTLFRRLRAEGVSFETVRDELRQRLAIHWLATERLSVKETAARLGYSAPGAFSRAFRRWTGSRPRDCAG